MLSLGAAGSYAANEGACGDAGGFAGAGTGAGRAGGSEAGMASSFRTASSGAASLKAAIPAGATCSLAAKPTEGLSSESGLLYTGPGVWFGGGGATGCEGTAGVALKSATTGDSLTASTGAVF